MVRRSALVVCGILAAWTCLIVCMLTGQRAVRCAGQDEPIVGVEAPKPTLARSYWDTETTKRPV